MTKETKADKIKRFVEFLSPGQHVQIQNIVGRTVTSKTLTALFTKCFKKTLAISSRKGKGRNCQKWVAQMISIFTGVAWGKDTEIVSREMGQSGADVRMSERIQNLFPYGIECKDDASWNIKKAIQQAKANTKPDTDWIVFHRQTDRNAEEQVEMVAIIDAVHFFELLQTIKLLKNPPKLMRRIKDGD